MVQHKYSILIYQIIKIDIIDYYRMEINLINTHKKKFVCFPYIQRSGC